MREAFKQLTIDGGIGRLRKVLTNQLRNQVAEEIQRQAVGDLGRLKSAFAEHLQDERLAKAQNPQDRKKAIRCSDEISQELIRWENECIPLLEQLGPSLQNNLLAQVREFITEDDAVLARLQRPQLADRLQALAEALQACMHDQLSKEILPKVFSDVGSRLAKLPALWSNDGPAQLWDRFGQEDQKVGQDWRNRLLPSFSCKGLAAELPDLPPREFRLLMREKAVCGSHHAMNGVKVRVRHWLGELLAKVNTLAYHGNGAAGQESSQ